MTAFYTDGYSLFAAGVLLVAGLVGAGRAAIREHARRRAEHKAGTA